MSRWTRTAAWSGLLLVLGLTPARAELGHFQPGTYGVRQTLLPETVGLRLDWTSSSYYSRRFNDSSGNPVDEVEIDLPVLPGFGQSITIPFDLNQAIHTQLPLLGVAFLHEEELGLRLGAYAVLPFGRGGLATTFVGALVREGNASWQIGDPLLVPLWIGWGSSRVELSFSYGVHAPWGHFDADDAVNVGRGFLGHQLQLSAGLWLDEERMAGGLLRVTYEVHGKYKDVDRTPGDSLSLEYGWSQQLFDYEGLRLNLDALGTSQFQVTSSRGADHPVVGELGKSQLHAAGGSLGFSYLPWGLLVSASLLYEYYAEARQLGVRFGLELRIDIPFRARKPLPE